MMLGISMIGTAETMNLAIRLGLDPKVFNEIINCSTGRSWASEVNLYEKLKLNIYYNKFLYIF